MGCLKLQVIFHQRATNYRALLQKITYEDKASYDFTPPCIRCCNTIDIHSYIIVHLCVRVDMCICVCVCVFVCVCVYALVGRQVCWVLSRYKRHQIFSSVQRYTATHCNTLQHTATHCNTLQHTATQHTWVLSRYKRHPIVSSVQRYTATHCNTLQHIMNESYTRFLRENEQCRNAGDIFM